MTQLMSSSPRYHSDHSAWDNETLRITPHCRDINPGDTNNNPPIWWGTHDSSLATEHHLICVKCLPQDIPHKELTRLTCWPSDGQSTTESCQCEDISAAWLVSPLRGARVCSSVSLSRVYAGWGHPQPAQSGHQWGISTTKSTFSRVICICNWFIHLMVSLVP